MGGNTLELQGRGNRRRDNTAPSRCPGRAPSPAAELSTQVSHSHRLHKNLSQLPICEQTKLSSREKPSQWGYRHKATTLWQMQLDGTLGVPVLETVHCSQRLQCYPLTPLLPVPRLPAQKMRLCFEEEVAEENFKNVPSW